jgi:hypothetical protein
MADEWRVTTHQCSLHNYKDATQNNGEHYICAGNAF